MEVGDKSTEPELRRPAVMSDVGKLAGVSHQTVSRVINGSPRVRPETRQRVIAAMRELAYRPNSVARALVTGRTNMLGVVGFDTTLYGPASTLFGIERAAHEAGYFPIAASLKALNESSVAYAVERLRAQGVEGILVIAPHLATAEALGHAPLDIPLVAVEAGPADMVPVVAVNQFAGAASATQHLLDLGHRSVWHIAGPPDWLESRERVQGWTATLEVAGVQPPALLFGDWSARSGYEHGRSLSRDPAVTAVFAANDQMALGVLRAMHETGRSIPEQVSLVGFDDIPEAPYFTPPLTTVRQDFIEVGVRSLGLLVAAIESGGAVVSGSLVEPELVVRASTAMPAERR